MRDEVNSQQIDYVRLKTVCELSHGLERALLQNSFTNYLIRDSFNSS